MMKNTKIALNQEVVQGKGNIVSDMGGEKVMLSINNGRYYNLGEVGGGIWDIIQEPMEVKDLVSILLNKYEVTQLQCEEQVALFLSMLLDEGLIKVIN
ncbi:lasso peptide biosynthesis PqqD family chaperone [Bacillus sp. ISL-35]|uniref:lasso peptide biosynthesis PqqD family chaperone n=1 Tax=Bacillus sp. ISL-35 TaxID=2819122 RepID=UPI001BEA89E9|nr:lasso peptide biosynthesis PqqD family chaperone [Bacillus sp. ISL-35]MBT2679841.1 lasso peptide biosynthesis PqqD family chaperone [Bacillus sp. ISL-35]MBT2704876.1 lasso peptide biosynthesis PqqD family chaperone [Chryseobacterium sp. ISL-80]